MQVVHVRVNDAATGQPTPVRIRFTTPDGRYLAPLGRLSEFPTGWNEDVGGNLLLGNKRYAYIDGTCEIRLPAGPITIEVSKGPEYTPIQQTCDRRPGQISLRLNLQRKFNLQQEAWYAGDTQVFALSPPAAWLEGAAEGLQVVNVLAAEWQRPDRTFFSNLLEFSGQQPALSRDHCLVVVNTQNRDETLGNLSLLNCHRVVYPLSLNWEGFEKWTLLDWCEQCHRKGGLVLWPNFPGCPGERIADLILGRIDAVEWTAPPEPALWGEKPDFASEGLQAWYRWLTCGFRVPLVGGSGKWSNVVSIGTVRTYAQLAPGETFTYQNWITAVRAGRTFVTRGPILRLSVNGYGPGTTLPLSKDGTSEFVIQATAESVLPLERLELVQNGAVISQATARLDHTAAISLSRAFQTPAWLAARCWGPDGLLAHTSPVYLGDWGNLVIPMPETLSLLEQLRQTLGWIETQVANPERRDRLRAIFAQARKLLEERLGHAPPS